MLDVEHYLTIYKGRKESMEKGITDPLPEGKKVINEIVERLSEMPLSEKIALEKREGNMVLMDSKGNTLVIFPRQSNDQSTIRQ
ncbi:MAG: hypothetical protein AAGF77_13920 [Bacteroidota bacterium]